MARALKVTVELEDVNGSMARLIRETPKAVRRFLSTAVFLTAGGVRREMEAGYNLGPAGEGRTPDQHLKLDVEHRGKTGSLHARVGIFDDEDQVAVALYNEYNPNRQAVQRKAAQAESEPFKQRALRALAQCERYLSQGF